MVDRPQSLVADKEPLLIATGLEKSYQHSGITTKILNGVNLELYAGESLAVVGASGIGKSTLLYLLGTLDQPDAGTLHIAQQDVLGLNDVKLSQFRNQAIGFVFQFHHLLPEFSALENTMMPALIHGWRRKVAEREAVAILERVGLSHRLHYRVARLSGGEQQRVALARALLLRPALLLADEPTGNLDQENSRQIHEMLLELNEELAMTLVVVTHNMELADCMARRVTLAEGILNELD